MGRLRTGRLDAGPRVKQSGSRIGGDRFGSVPGGRARQGLFAPGRRRHGCGSVRRELLGGRRTCGSGEWGLPGGISVCRAAKLGCRRHQEHQ